MCYHVSTPTKQELRKILMDDINIKPYESYFHTTGFDHVDLPVLTAANPAEVVPMKWGLVPHWTKSVVEAKEAENKTLNARAETLFTTPMFRNYAPHNRCLIFVNGFYEWKHEGKNKIPYFIFMPDGEPFAIGGVYASWEHPDWWRHEGCSIVTTASDSLMSEIHNTKLRMPLVLPESKWSKWLDTTLNPMEAGEILKPYNEAKLCAHTISKLISSRTEDSNVPQVQEKVELPPDTLF